MRIYCALLMIATQLLLTVPAAAEAPVVVKAFLANHCADCHVGDFAEADFDVVALPDALDRSGVYEQWVRVVDRVAAGEMPPADSPKPNGDDSERFVAELSGWLTTAANERTAREGRVLARKLTALQVERSLHDVLNIDIPLASLLPEEPRTHGYNTVASGQSVSHFDLENHLMVVDTALDEAFRRTTRSDDQWVRNMSAEDLSRDNPRRRCRDPEYYRDMAVTWSSGLVFYGRISSTSAREDGWYRFSFDVSSLNTPDYGVWSTVRTGYCTSSAPLMKEVATFLATDSPQTVTVEAWLEKGQMFEVRPSDDRLKKGRTAGGQVGAGEIQPQKVPGIGMHSATLSRIHLGSNDDAVRNTLFADLSLKYDSKGRLDSVVSDDPNADLERLMTRFARRAFRRPVATDEIQPYIDLAKKQLDSDGSLVDAVRGGYRALLCSPKFLYLYEEPGVLDDYALAARLSYFLWNSTPDEELLHVAEQNRLHEPKVLKEQVERMLQQPLGEQFMADFAEQWLDLSQIDFTEPDRRLYPNFDLVLQQSMLAETRSYLNLLLTDNLNVSHVIDSDFALLNERLATHYGIEGVEGEELRKVLLSDDDPRGGLLTQGAVLKVTANGTNTSPVIRGVWISERLLGIEVPPPPQNVPAVEPDIRGATTIREQLDKHRSDTGCASCHTKVDPAGFALENFDPVGRWRSHYVRREGSKIGKGPSIDASYALLDGAEFTDVVGFQKIYASRPEQLARNLAAQWVTYGTGAPVSFADREELQQITVSAADSGYGVHDLLHAVVQSELFRRK